MEHNDIVQLKETGCRKIDAHMTDLESLSRKVMDALTQCTIFNVQQIHANPELAYEEHNTSNLLSDFLQSHGFQVERQYCGLKTAFRATAGRGPPTIAVMSEMDALPEVGHACGHNLIAVAGVATGLGVKAILEESGHSGTIVVLGTPAEEIGGGKCDLIRAGAFKDIDAGMMVHPGNNSLAHYTSLAVTEIHVTFHGKSAHAAASPWEGVNALDAVILSFNAVGLLRQQIRPTDRIHGIITHGGHRPNVIPDRASASFFVRSPSGSGVLELADRVRDCFEGAARATGCSLEISGGMEYREMNSSRLMAELYTKNLHCLGLNLDPVEEQLKRRGGSTDFGNVSHVIPCIHPRYAICDDTNIHSKEFASQATTDRAHAETFRAAKGLVMTAADVMLIPGILREIGDEFSQGEGKPLPAIPDPHVQP
ncbi:hypothetical protein PROFUN_11487 [Planoprotostelium fungivorum]|uniref:Peptidase M20 domain-containing protein 2 n=1 Tax=Planoprotostelium fungivorum TaxID=1890364 RepID=A0A2P6N9W8_9EUKA|nr:hypothetical protein PROFUN_11487 [Planoprotostelium fungivorum]